MHLILFSCENHKYALPLERILRILHALEITPIPEAPQLLLGVFDLHGQTIPVLSLRELFSLVKKDIELDDTLIVIQIHTYLIALLCDHVIGVYELEPEKSSEALELFPGLVMSHLVRWEGSLIPLLDIETLIDHELVRVLNKKGEEHYHEPI